MQSTKILKSNQLIPITKSFTNMDEIRVFNSCLVDNYQRKLFLDSEFYPIDIESYAKKGGISQGKAFREILPILDKLKENVNIDLTDGSIYHTSYIYDYISNEEFNTISVQWNKKIIPMISGDMDKGTFCYYDDNMGDVPSNKRYLLYELIQRHLYLLNSKKEFYLSVREMREETNTKANEYPEFKEFNRRVIKPTLQDISKILKINIDSKGVRYSAETVKVRFWEIHKTKLMYTEEYNE